MISYELAKQLKDAGFPQDDSGIVLTEYGTSDAHSANEMGYDYASIPTLSELIEACGEESPLVITVGKAVTIVLHGKTGMVCTSPTPEQAVAKLWLEINKK